MKTCSKCYIEKPLKDFYQRKTGSRSGEYYEKCSSCYTLRGREYYHKNRKRQLELALNGRHGYLQILRKLVNEYKEKIPCMDCKKNYPPYVMDFDHRDPSQKINSIGRVGSKGLYTISQTIREIEKCDLVCANCHRIRTYKDRMVTHI